MRCILPRLFSSKSSDIAAYNELNHFGNRHIRRKPPVLRSLVVSRMRTLRSTSYPLGVESRSPHPAQHLAFSPSWIYRKRRAHEKMRTLLLSLLCDRCVSSERCGLRSRCQSTPILTREGGGECTHDPGCRSHMAVDTASLS